MADEDYLVDRELTKEKRRLEEDLCRADATDYADYKYRCGVICGISFAMQTLEDARNRAIQEDESDA
jgi:hypothetical protein